VTRRPAMVSRLLTVLLLVPLVWLTPLALASPPDQTWIGGFYDDADYDDVVLLAMSLALALGDLAPAAAVGLIVVAVLLLIDVKAAPLTVRLGASSRAPPAHLARFAATHPRAAPRPERILKSARPAVRLVAGRGERAVRTC
jgi:hypothetical protein